MTSRVRRRGARSAGWRARDHPRRRSRERALPRSGFRAARREERTNRRRPPCISGGRRSIATSRKADMMTRYLPARPALADVLTWYMNTRGMPESPGCSPPRPAELPAGRRRDGPAGGSGRARTAHFGSLLFPWTACPRSQVEGLPAARCSKHHGTARARRQSISQSVNRGRLMARTSYGYLPAEPPPVSSA
jgi:hypothetical protein